MILDQERVKAQLSPAPETRLLKRIITIKKTGMVKKMSKFSCTCISIEEKCNLQMGLKFDKKITIFPINTVCNVIWVLLIPLFLSLRFSQVAKGSLVRVIPVQTTLQSCETE